MNCLEYRRVVGADPSAQTPALLTHAASCDACRRYRDEMQRMDQLIYRALNIDVQKQSERTRRPQRWVPRWAAAASIVAASLLASLLWLSMPRESFAEELVAHVEGEPHALVRSGDAIEAAPLDDVLARSGVRLERNIGTISYAMNCWFRGHYVPHLVVQTDDGPVTVLVLTEERRPTRRETFREGGFRGVVLPAPRGAVAVLAQDAQAEQVAERFLQSVEYQP